MHAFVWAIDGFQALVLQKSTFMELLLRSVNQAASLLGFFWNHRLADVFFFFRALGMNPGSVTDMNQIWALKTHGAALYSPYNLIFFLATSLPLSFCLSLSFSISSQFSSSLSICLSAYPSTYLPMDMQWCRSLHHGKYTTRHSEIHVYFVGCWLVERRQLSCVFCFGGVGDSVIFTLRSNTLLLLRSSCLKCSVGTVGWAGVGRGRVGDNVMFTLCLTRFCCYALLFVKYSVGTVGWAGVGWVITSCSHCV